MREGWAGAISPKELYLTFTLFRALGFRIVTASYLFNVNKCRIVWYFINCNNVIFYLEHLAVVTKQINLNLQCSFIMTTFMCEGGTSYPSGCTICNSCNRIKEKKPLFGTASPFSGEYVWE